MAGRAPGRLGDPTPPRAPRARDATITTFQPLTDTSYVPCVSLLDSWIPNGAAELVVYAHSLDFAMRELVATALA